MAPARSLRLSAGRRLSHVAAPQQVLEEALESESAGAAPGNAPAASDGVSEWEPALNATPLLPPREPVGARIAALMGRHHLPLLLLCVVLLWCIVALPPLSPPESLQPGQVASHDILAPYGTMLLDRGETSRRQAEAAALAPPRYEPDPNAQDRARSRLRALLDAVRIAQRDTLAPRPVPNTASSPKSNAANRSGDTRRKSEVRNGERDLARPSVTASKQPSTRERWARSFELAHGDSVPLTLENALSSVGASIVASKSRAASAAASKSKGTGASGTPLPRGVLGDESRLSSSSGASTWAAGEERWAVIERAAQDGVRAFYQARVRADVAGDSVAGRARIAASVAKSVARWPMNADDARAATEIAARAAREPNLLVDEGASRRDRDDASSGVRQVFVRVRAGEILAHEGESISREKWAQLQELGLVEPRLDARAMLWQALLCAFLVGLCSVFVSRLHPKLLRNPTLLWMCAAIPLLFLLFLRYTLRVPHAENVALPLAATAAMLLTVLADARMGIIAGFVVSVAGAVMARSDLPLFVCTALLSWTGAMGVAGIASRGHLLRAGILMALAGGATHLLLGLMRLEPLPVVLSLGAWGVASGVLSILAMAALAMLLERPFGITTHLRLLELLSPDESVLQKMLHEAPGTYTHSMMVAQLSEAAAKAVGDADAMLCRAGGMYHDIGKLRRPFCFIENQSGDNVHDRISPTLSALVIAAHVRDGLEAGRAMRLPTPILDIIAQHHGTGLISFFYEKARAQNAAQNPETEIDEAKFRYPGPKPQSKEAAIVMLADTVEASSRALPDAQGPKLRAHIHAMIQSRLREGELSHSDLTLRDLEIIEDAFARALSGALHGRIAYPGKAEIERDLRESALGNRPGASDAAQLKEKRSKPARRQARELRPPRASKVQAALQAARDEESEAKTPASTCNVSLGKPKLAKTEANATPAQNGKNGHNGSHGKNQTARAARHEASKNP